MIRIRYKKGENGLLKSGELLGKDAVYEIQINPETLYSAIYNANNKSLPPIPVKAFTLPALKKAVKKELQALGVVFQSEVRPRLKYPAKHDDFEGLNKEFNNEIARDLNSQREK